MGVAQFLEPPRNDTFETRDPLNWGAILLQRIGTMVVALISNVSRNHWDCISTYCRWAVGLASSCVFWYNPRSPEL